jgi:hypothetical protein
LAGADHSYGGGGRASLDRRCFRVLLSLYGAAALVFALDFSAPMGGKCRRRSRGIRKLGVKVLVNGGGVEQPLAVELRELLEDGRFLGSRYRGRTPSVGFTRMSV